MAEKKRVKSRKAATSLRTKAVKISAIESNVVSAKIGFRKKDVKIMDRGRGKSLLISRGVPRDNPGSPALPWKKYYLAVPWDAVPGKLSVANVKTVKLADKIMIDPCQSDEPPVVGNIIKRVPPDEKVYASKSVWPKNMARVGQVKRYGGFALAEIEVCPFRYIPKSGRLDMIQRMEIELNFKRTKKERKRPDSISVYMHEEMYAEKVKRKVLNPDDVEGFKTFGDVKDGTDFSRYPRVDHVIITSSDLAEEFRRLAAWRTQLGLQSRVVTVEDILTGTVPDAEGKRYWMTSGYVDGGIRDTAEAIRNFIKWAAVHWLIDYVLLGGDTEVIPPRYAFHTRAGSIDYGDINNPIFYLTSSITLSASSSKPGSDVYYAEDTDWSTAWECESDDVSPWIHTKFTSPTYVNGVMLVWGAQAASSYTVQISDDGVAWSDVYSATSGPDGNVKIPFNCVFTRNVRVLITSGTDFALVRKVVLGPDRKRYGVAYQMSPTVTRLFLEDASKIQPNQSNSLDVNTFIIREGPHAGLIVPYNHQASSTNLGWRFVPDLLAMSGSVSANATRFIEICGPAEYHGQPFAVKLNHLNYIPTDLYYSDIAESDYVSGTTHDWDADNNKIYGERYGGEVDGVNGLEDISVGRAPVETIEEAAVFVGKVIQYERFEDKNGALLPSDFAVSVLLGAQNLGIYINGTLDNSAAEKEDVRAILHDYDPSRWIFTRLYEDFEDLPPASDLEQAGTAQILQAIMDSNNIVSFSGHGSYTSLCYLTRNEVENVVSHPAVFFGNSCLTNGFDYNDGEAFSEVCMLNPDGAAVAYVGNTRNGNGTDLPVELTFWEEMFNSGILGEMFNQGKATVTGWPSYSYNLLGDPAMRVWSDRPLQLDVAHPSEIYTGSQILEVDVTSQGQPITNAVVCASMAGTLHVKGTTNSSGAAVLNIAPSVEGTMHVAVSGKNLIPYLDAIEVEQARVNCIASVSCTSAITCPLQLGCAKSVSCKELVACGSGLTCKAEIACRSQIMCTKSINCPLGVTCLKSIACGLEITCGAKVSCGSGIGCPLINDPCPRVLPKEFDRPKGFIRDIWGVQDIAIFIKDTDPERIEGMINDLPKEMQKSVRMMFDRIRKDTKVK